MSCDNGSFYLQLGHPLELLTVTLLFDKIHLNVGTGEACAPQARATDSWVWVTMFSVASEENLGAEPPIGSEYYKIKMRASNLNAGLGLDWAGHVRAIDSWLTAKICSIATEENLGTLLPMGSGIILQLENVTLYYCLNAFLQAGDILLFPLWDLIIVLTHNSWLSMRLFPPEWRNWWALSWTNKIERGALICLKRSQGIRAGGKLGRWCSDRIWKHFTQKLLLMNWDRLWAVNVCVGVGELYFCYPSINGEFFSEVF